MLVWLFRAKQQEGKGKLIAKTLISRYLISPRFSLTDSKIHPIVNLPEQLSEVGARPDSRVALIALLKISLLPLVVKSRNSWLPDHDKVLGAESDGRQ